jgi:hypothetical protein
MPENIGGIIPSEVLLPCAMFGLTVTSGGEIVLVERLGPRVEVYSHDLTHLQTVNVPGALSLLDIASRGDLLFITDKIGECIHVVMGGESSTHNISVDWAPIGLAISDYTLFVTDERFDILYSILLDRNYRRLGDDQVVLAAPHLGFPGFLHVTATRIAVGNADFGKLVVASRPNGTIEWTYGAVGSGDGELNDPKGVAEDGWNRYIVADGENKRVVLVSSNGTFIRNLAIGLSRKPVGVSVLGNMVYVVLRGSPGKLIRLEIV